MRSLGITSGLSTTFQPRPDFCTITSGTTMFASARANGRARLRLERDDQRLRLAQQGLVGAGDGHQLLQVAPREQRAGAACRR